MNPPVCVVRSVRTSDEPAALALASALDYGVAPWRDPTGARHGITGWVGQMFTGLPAQDRCDLVATVDDVLAGLVSARIEPHWTGSLDAYVGVLVVHRAHRRRGIGAELLDRVRSWAMDCSLEHVTLHTGASNAEARAFYADQGFGEEDVRMTVRLM